MKCEIETRARSRRQRPYNVCPEKDVTNRLNYGAINANKLGERRRGGWTDKSNCRANYPKHPTQRFENKRGGKILLLRLILCL